MLVCMSFLFGSMAATCALFLVGARIIFRYWRLAIWYRKALGANGCEGAR